MKFRHLALACLAATAMFAAPLAQAQDRIVVFAAASLKNALDAAAAKYHANGGAEISVSYGSSLTLARQIVAGAPADVIFSADEASLDEAAKSNAIKPETRKDVLGNALALIEPKTGPDAKVGFDRDSFVKALGDGKLATGDIAAVPVGKYAKAALTKLGLWETVEPHLALTPDVRTALAFVARGEAALGIVYATDANAEPKVKVVATFAEETHAPIHYPIAIAASSANPEAAKFVAFLESPEASPFFTGQGFTALK